MPPPTFSVDRLSERERDVLRLLARGHDAKSSAAELGISAVAVAERLRAARRKLGVSSSREAARRFAAAEGEHQFSGDSLSGLAERHASAPDRPMGAVRHARTVALVAGGLAAMSIALAALLFSAAQPSLAEGPLPNWRVAAAEPVDLASVRNRVHLVGNSLLWNGEQVSLDQLRTFLQLIDGMRPQPATILSHGRAVPSGRLPQVRGLIDATLRCTPATCVELTRPR